MGSVEVEKELWLGQPTDAAILLNADNSNSPWCTLLSLGDVVRKPNLRRKFSRMFREELQLGGPVMIDSGGFTIAQRPNTGWSSERVISIYEGLSADRYVALDFPPCRHDRKADRVEKIIRGAHSYSLFRDSFEQEVVPVVHGRELDEIEYSIELTSSVHETPEVIGLGGVVPLLMQSAKKKSGMAFIKQAISKISASFPSSKIHVFGAGSPQTIKSLYDAGVDSVDSMAWRHAAAFGSIYLKGGVQRLLPGAEKENRSRPTLSAHEIHALQECVCPSCAEANDASRVEILAKSFRARAVHNAWNIRETFAGQISLTS